MSDDFIMTIPDEENVLSILVLYFIDRKKTWFSNGMNHLMKK